MIGRMIGIIAAMEQAVDYSNHRLEQSRQEREALYAISDSLVPPQEAAPVGHQADGSSIQNHSCGSHYPYIVGKQEGQLRPWFIMDPSGEIKWRFMEASVAFEAAEHLARRRAAKATIQRICEQGGHHGNA